MTNDKCLCVSGKKNRHQKHRSQGSTKIKMVFNNDGCVEKMAEPGLLILLTNIHIIHSLCGNFSSGPDILLSELQEIFIQVLLKFVFVLITNRDVNFTEDNTATFNRINFIEIDDKRPVHTHKLLFG